MKNLINISNETKQAIKTWMHLSEKFKNAYFWNSPSNASGRRAMEDKNAFTFSNEVIDLQFSISCSCKNIYVSKSVVINDKQTNATALKKYIK